MAKEVIKQPSGRPTKYSPAVVVKLESAFASAFSIEQACLYAGVHRDTFYAWLEAKPGFSDRMVKARERPTMKAKEVVVESINAGDTTSAKWWLERRAPDEFAPRPDKGTAPVTNNFLIIANEQKDKYDFA